MRYWADRAETRREQSRFARARKAELRYARRLRGFARHIGSIIDAFRIRLPEDLPVLLSMLQGYAKTSLPWAEAVSASMLADVSRRDEQVWAEISREMGRNLRREIATAPTGAALQVLMAENVGLITSLPIEAGERIQKFILEGLSDSRRADEVAREIMRSSEVTQSRATLIARTETSRAASGLTQVRAEHIGSPGYIWRTAQDTAVRKSHEKMEGKFVAWDKPPTLSDGTTTHAGQIFNCRCFAEVVIPDQFGFGKQRAA